MTVIGLTGTSGSGKGAVSNIMAKNGAYIIDCDKIAHENMEIGGIAYNDIVTAFGKTILNCDGSISRQSLGSIVFTDINKLSLLNRITHKYICEGVMVAIEKHRDKKCVVIDAPLLFESRLNQICDYIWVVNANTDVRLKRVMERDGITKEQALLRFRNKKYFITLAEKSDFIIENNGSLETLENIVKHKMINQGLTQNFYSFEF